MSVKRIDRTVQMMRELEKQTADALEQAALKLQSIAKRAVSRKYVKRPRIVTAYQQALFEERRRAIGRKYFLSLPAKRKRNGPTQT
jgi:hypothetical protein